MTTSWPVWTKENLVGLDNMKIGLDGNDLVNYVLNQSGLIKWMEITC